MFIRIQSPVFKDLVLEVEKVKFPHDSIVTIEGTENAIRTIKQYFMDQDALNVVTDSCPSPEQPNDKEIVFGWIDLDLAMIANNMDLHITFFG